jgi:hypothetical protein
MNALAVKCPSCGALGGEQCRTHASAELISLRKHGKTKSDHTKKAQALSVCAPHAARLAAAERSL